MDNLKVNFFEGSEQVYAKLFGICDDPDDGKKTPAYVDACSANKSNWIAIVCNKSEDSVMFNAIDNHVEIKRADGNMENRCDALLWNENYIIFVELKDQEKEWIKHAVEDQLDTTIRIFKENHDITKFSKRLAYACNKKHPNFASGHIELMQRFRNEHSVRLVICQNIVLK